MTFHNLTPAIPGFYSDPTWCVGPDGVYLAHSSFEYFPGAPVFRSTDLVAWEQVGNVIDRPDQLDLATFAGASAGIYGSTLRHHDGRFWFVTTNIGEFMRGQLIFHAEDAAGPWSDPVAVEGTLGIDPDLVWTDDGDCLLTWNHFHGDGRGQVRIDPLTGARLSEIRHVWPGTGTMKAPEGPHLYHVGDWWYVLLAEGGTEKGHSVTIARASRPDAAPDEWEPHPANPVLTHRSTDHPVQSVGHADLIEHEGRWWACYHGVRPQGRTPSWHLIGRETFICPVEWVDGWPVFREDLAVAHPFDTALADDFTDTPGPRWVVPQGDLSHATPGPAGLALAAGRPLVIRVQDLEWTAEATFDVESGTGRLLVYLDDDHWYAIEAGDGRVRALGQAGPFTTIFGEAGLPAGPTVTLRLSAALPEQGPRPADAPDLISMSVVDGDAVATLATVDGRYVSTEVASGFTGRTVGVQALDGAVTVRSFRYGPGQA